MANQMTMKPFRTLDNHEIIELYSAVEGNLPAGTIVEYVSADPDNSATFNSPFSSVPGYAFVGDLNVAWKVQAAQSGSNKVAGITLKSVVTNISDPWTYDARFATDGKLAEQQVVPSGRAVAFAMRGQFEVTGLDVSQQAPSPGAPLYPSPTNPGCLAVGTATPTGSLVNATKVGHCMTSSGVNGNTLIFISVR